MGARADAGGAGGRPVTGPVGSLDPVDGAARNAPDPVGHGGADVVIDSVGKTFRRGGRRTVALAGISLEVRARELVCLLGPSGCGKSTLLRIAAGALEQAPTWPLTLSRRRSRPSQSLTLEHSFVVTVSASARYTSRCSSSMRRDQ